MLSCYAPSTISHMRPLKPGKHSQVANCCVPLGPLEQVPPFKHSTSCVQSTEINKQHHSEIHVLSDYKQKQ